LEAEQGGFGLLGLEQGADLGEFGFEFGVHKVAWCVVREGGRKGWFHPPPRNWSCGGGERNCVAFPAADKVCAS
jgi:hypothetical protein